MPHPSLPPGFRSPGARSMIFTPPGTAAGEEAYRRFAADLGLRDPVSLRDRDLGHEDARHVAFMAAGFGMGRDQLVTVPPRRR